MTIRKRTILIISVMLACVAVVVFFISRYVLLNNFIKLDEDATRDNISRAINAVNSELDQLDNTTVDWSSWDDTYSFIQDAGPAYIKANLVDGTFVSLELNLMMFVDSSNQVVFSKAFDLQNEEEAPVPESLQKYLSYDNILLDHSNAESGASGIILLPEGSMLVASRPILTSEDEGPVRGTLIMGRYLGDTLLQQIAEETGQQLSAYQFGYSLMPPDFQEAGSYLSRNTPVFIKNLDEQNMAGYALLWDIYGKPALILKTDIPREIYAQGQVIVSYHMVLLIALGIICAAVVMLIFQKTILSRMTGLSHNVADITRTGDLSERVTVQGNDEISSLSNSINNMLEALLIAQEGLKTSEERFRSLTENTFDVVMIISMDETIKYVSPSLKRVLGYEPEEWINKKSYDFLHPEDLSQLADAAAEGLDRQRFTKTMELRIRHKDDSWRYIEAVGINLLSEPVIEGIVINFRDVTERKQAENTLQVLYKEETRLRKDLEVEFKRRAEFTRALVHELKTPLTPVLTSSDILATELEQEPYLSLARNINRGAERLNKRIDELLDLARGEIGALRLTFTPVKPLELLRDIVNEITPTTSRSNQSLELDLPPSLSPVRGDEDRLRQVVVNLLDNAHKLTPDGGKITVRAGEQDSSLMVEVQDTGPGISRKDQERLFQPYYRGEDDRQRFSGLGLGLALCKIIVELHGGKIWVHSDKGKGSTFGFSIPIMTTESGR